MFYTMKAIFLLIVAMSFMLVGATIVVAFPIQAEASWCFTFNDCFNGKGPCEKDNPGTTPCIKLDKKK